ncbi:MAG TPA: hypothetical protein ACFYD1_09405 [Candidatus Hypogeohydataceae bacterium YC38]
MKLYLAPQGKSNKKWVLDSDVLSIQVGGLNQSATDRQKSIANERGGG